MRKIWIRGLILKLTFIFILMFIANLIVLRVYFNVRLFDLLFLVGDSPVADDVSAESNYCIRSLPDRGDPMNLINELSLRDKITLAQIVSRIGKDDMTILSDISQDGITADEISALREYAAERLAPSDVEVLEEILDRNRHLYADNLR